MTDRPVSFEEFQKKRFKYLVIRVWTEERDLDEIVKLIGIYDDNRVGEQAISDDVDQYKHLFDGDFDVSEIRRTMDGPKYEYDVGCENWYYLMYFIEIR